MNKSLIVADNFSPLADDIRRIALSQEFKTVEFMGHNYPGILQNESLEKELRDHLCPLLANLVGFNIVPLLTFFRLGLKDQKPDIYIHSDKAIGAEWAGVFYLSRPSCSSPPGRGTAFWSHKELGWDRLPSPLEIAAQNLSWDQTFCDRLNEDGRHEERWTMNSLVGMKYNRMIAYPGNLFHSRYPRDYLSEQKEEGRLIWVCFFNRAAKP